MNTSTVYEEFAKQATVNTGRNYSVNKNPRFLAVSVMIGIGLGSDNGKVDWSIRPMAGYSLEKLTEAKICLPNYRNPKSSLGFNFVFGGEVDLILSNRIQLGVQYVHIDNASYLNDKVGNRSYFSFRPKDDFTTQVININLAYIFGKGD